MYFFSLLCMLGLFSACSDDDKVEPIGTEFDGVYKGTLDVDLDGTKVGADLPQKVYVTKVGDNLIKMELKNFSFGAMALGNISVDKCNVEKQGDNACQFDGEQKLSLPMVGDCDVVMNGTITGEKLEMVINVKATQEGAAITVKVDFVGTKLASDQSSEAKITEFTFDSKEVVSQPVIDGTSITFMVTDTIKAEELAALVPTIKISEKATISPASGVAQDFSSPVIYTVTSEDGIVTTKYTVSVSGKVLKFSFDEWVEKGDNRITYMTPIPLDKLDSSNGGADLLVNLPMAGGGSFEGGFPVLRTDDAKEGAAAAKLVTLYTEGAGLGMAPVITSGSLFTGLFDLNFFDQLSSTKFGILHTSKPLRFKGYYKYTAGEGPFYNGKATETLDQKDKCSIAAILFEIEKDNDVLTGHDINSSEKVVAEARLADGSDKAEYTAFDLEFKWKKDYDASKKYKLAIVCSSSAEGDAFKGAAGSTLIIDEFEVISE
ncbi:PCMD domain-containing protein [Parabacteroides goldsteinii]|uniref:PCMD domain-containing protein n=1 Tax=Parabacteroides goldsteinii TaxID=328812 RepID=UPI0021655147|nr:PCMD domain-containing protein [Parabacteroides goldsteinii]MCS2425498.1 PCMD domain-containing protein [Parabacteroides goldsteinii]